MDDEVFGDDELRERAEREAAAMGKVMRLSPALARLVQEDQVEAALRDFHRRFCCPD